MLTGQELIHALLVPVIVAGPIAAIGRWRCWPWAMPLAAGAGFLTGYALLGVPSLPPHDGTDWLFWLAIPLTLLAVVEAVVNRFPRGADAETARTDESIVAAATPDTPASSTPGRSMRFRSLTPWTWTFGAAAGLVALVIMLPLTRVGSLSTAATVTTPLLLALAGATLVVLLRFAADRLGPFSTLAGLCIVIAGAGVIIMSSNLRIVGIYGLAAATAIAPVATLCHDYRAARAVSIFAIPLLAGLLTAGHYYPDPGVTWTHFMLILNAPSFLALVAAIPMRRTRVRAALAILAVGILVGAVTIPMAIAAKQAAESDPYEAYY
jgi:hypothetical protein